MLFIDPSLLASFVMMSLGSGGIRLWAMAFGADQLDKRDNSTRNVRRLQTFFNWYYTMLGLSIVVASTVIVYIQQAKGWVVGFAVPVAFMVTALVLFLVGSPFYLKEPADRSVLVGLVQVLVASYKNRHEPLPPDTADPSFYNKPGSTARTPTRMLRYLNRACVLANKGNTELCARFSRWRTQRPSSASYDLVDGDLARSDHRAADVPRAAGEHDGAAGGPVLNPRGILRCLGHPHAHRLGDRVRTRAGVASVAAHGPRARAQPAPAHGPRPRALRRGHGCGRAHREHITFLTHYNSL
jgi:hypothetical protein